MQEIVYHVPVLLKESVDGMNIGKGGNFVDVTFGGGGHSREILSRLDKDGHLYSFDQDADAEKNVEANDKFTFVRSNFRYLKNFMRYYGVEHIDGLLADLGVSSHHFDDSDRGFSFRFDEVFFLRAFSYLFLKFEQLGIGVGFQCCQFFGRSFVNFNPTSLTCLDDFLFCGTDRSVLVEGFFGRLI